MGIAENLLGRRLPGVRIAGDWIVVERIDQQKKGTDGCFSVGYKVRHENGREAFLKASDLGLLTEQTASLFERTVVAVEAQKFERRILEHCRGNNMDRIVLAIDYGDQLIVHDGIKEPIFYLIFELAECDARVQIDRLKHFDLTWSVTALHNLAIAIKQLHTGEVSHNDIKPSNFLIFELLQKLGDLGSATSPLIPAVHDERICVGDPRYAAPEILYQSSTSSSTAQSFQTRRASDLYLLGSMAHFFVTGVMITPTVVSHLNPVHRPRSEGGGWTGTFAGVLPYWRRAFAVVLEEFENALPTNDAAELTPAARAFMDSVTQLCEPDPVYRGHPLERLGHHDPLSVERYISLFDRLRSESLVVQ
ncbi:MAG: serine/threonine protein kinase [Gemmatimonadetes bacterium]|nr:serine/threonine protein kinase [Gemmatimonadota bacterium]